MAVRSSTVTTKTPPVDDPATTDVDESKVEDSAPTQDPNTSSVSDTAVLPDAPYTEEEVSDLAVSLQRNGPFYLGNDVRSKESATKVAKSVLDSVIEMGWEKPTIKAETKEVIADSQKVDEGSPNAPQTTGDLTGHTPQSGPTPSGVSSTPGALQDNPAPTDASVPAASSSSSTDPSKPPTTGDTSSSSSATESSPSSTSTTTSSSSPSSSSEGSSGASASETSSNP